MYPSVYNVTVRDFPERGSSLVSNTLHASIAVVSNEVLPLLEEGRPIPSLAEPDRLALLEEGFIQESPDREKALATYYFESRKYDKTFLESVIMTTEACNMRCKYCFERGVHSPKIMSPETAEAVADRLAQSLSDKTVEFSVEFFGGEPLLNTAAISVISRKLSVHCAKKGIRLFLRVATNGILLTRSNYDLLCSLGIDRIQVTLDGPPEVHDYRRPLAGGRGTFDIIMRNLAHCDRERPTVTIRINVDRQNYRSIPQLLLQLKDRIATFRNQKPRIYVAPVEMSQQPSDGWNDNVFSPSERAEVLCSLWEYMHSIGLPVFHLPTYYPCGILTDWPSIIGVNGEVYACSELVGRPGFKRGSLFEDSMPSTSYLKFLTRDAWRDCLGCKYLPLCGGGCRVQAMIKTGDPFRIDCQKEFFDKAYPVFLRVSYGEQDKNGGAESVKRTC